MITQYRIVNIGDHEKFFGAEAVQRLLMLRENRQLPNPLGKTGFKPHIPIRIFSHVHASEAK